MTSPTEGVIRIEAADIRNGAHVNRVAGFIEAEPYATAPLNRYQQWLRGDAECVEGHYTQAFKEEEIERHVNFILCFATPLTPISIVSAPFQWNLALTTMVSIINDLIICFILFLRSPNTS